MAMDVIFFDGFNFYSQYEPTYFKELDDHWSVDGDISFNGSANFANRPYLSGLSANTTLTLQNFTDPFINHNGFGLGVRFVSGSIATPVSGISPFPSGENLISFYNGAGAELRIDILQTTFYGSGSMGFAVYENNSLLDIYDVGHYVGSPWYTYDNGNLVQLGSSNAESYVLLEIYIDSEQISMRLPASSLDTAPLLNSASGLYTAISPLDNLSSIKFYGHHNASIYDLKVRLHELYLTASDSEAEALLGYNTSIFSLNQYGFNDIAQMDWQSPEGLIYSSGINDIALWNVEDTYYDAPVGAIKIQQTIRKSFPSNDADCTNVMTSGAGGPIINIGDIYNINSIQYTSKSSILSINPVTSSPWTIQELNDMQIGIKSLGPQ